VLLLVFQGADMVFFLGHDNDFALWPWIVCQAPPETGPVIREKVINSTSVLMGNNI
jgi:hypothetical protein